MNDRKFDPAKLDKLNNPERLQVIDPDKLWAALEPDHPQVLVDIGAGTGLFARAFADKMPEGDIYACDLSPVMIDWMRQHVVPNFPRIHVQPSTETATGLADGIADLVIMINLHHELERPEALLVEAYRLLKNGGKVLVVDWKKQETGEGPPLEIRVEAEEIMRQLRVAGFSAVRSQETLEKHSLVTGLKPQEN